MEKGISRDTESTAEIGELAARNAMRVWGWGLAGVENSTEKWEGLKNGRRPKR